MSIIDETNRKVIKDSLEEKFPGIELTWQGWDFNISIPDDMEDQIEEMQAEFDRLYGSIGGVAEFGKVIRV